MKILSVQSLVLPEVKVVRTARYHDHRGYFSEVFRESAFAAQPELDFLHGLKFQQVNESVSKPWTCRGMHFQWNPYMGKFVRTVYGRMIDMVMDVRKGSPNFGKIIAYDMPTDDERDFSEWIWVPIGFAHGNFFPVPTRIEYLCTGEYSPKCEAGISPLAPDLDWSLFDPELNTLFHDNIPHSPLFSDKDKNGLTLDAWLQDERSEQFVYKR
jgi:dTDP-4-dehydrorhamnose 3,5-epimerase